MTTDAQVSVIVPAIAVIGLLGIMAAMEKVVAPILIDVLVTLGIKSTSAAKKPDAIIEAATGYAAQIGTPRPKRRSLWWKIRHGQWPKP